MLCRQIVSGPGKNDCRLRWLCFISHTKKTPRTFSQGTKSTWKTKTNPHEHAPFETSQLSILGHRASCSKVKFWSFSYSLVTGSPNQVTCSERPKKCSWNSVLSQQKLVTQTAEKDHENFVGAIDLRNKSAVVRWRVYSFLSKSCHLFGKQMQHTWFSLHNWAFRWWEILCKSNISHHLFVLQLVQLHKAPCSHKRRAMWLIHICASNSFDSLSAFKLKSLIVNIHIEFNQTISSAKLCEQKWQNICVQFELEKVLHLHFLHFFFFFASSLVVDWQTSTMDLEGNPRQNTLS